MKVYILFVFVLSILQPSFAEKKQDSFLEDFDKISMSWLPFLGKYFKSKDILRSRLRTMSKWQKKNPLQMYKELRNHRPVARMSSIPNLSGDYSSVETILVTNRDDVIQIFKQPSLYTVQVYGNRMKGLGEHMLSRDKTEYNLVEKPWMRSLMPRTDMGRIAKILSEITSQIVTELKSEKKSFNLVQDYARKVPALFSDKYFGFPGPSLKKIYKWSKTTQRNYFHNVLNKPRIRKASVKSEQEMIEYGTKLINDIKSGKVLNRNSVLYRMLHSKEVSVGEITERRVLINIIGAFVGSIETTQNAFINILEELQKRPKFYKLAVNAAMKNDLSTLSKVAWEALRFNPINPMMVRFTSRDTNFYPSGDKSKKPFKIKKGSTVLLGLQSGMFDEKRVNKPNEFLLTRSFDTYFHFGYGHHRCLGEMINMIQIPIMLKAVLSQPNFKVLKFKKSRRSPFPEKVKAVI